MNCLLNYIECNKQNIPDYNKIGGVFFDYFSLMNKNKKEHFEMNEIEALMMRIVSMKGKDGLKKSLNYCKNIMMKNVRILHFENIRKFNQIKEGNGEKNYVN